MNKRLPPTIHPALSVAVALILTIALQGEVVTLENKNGSTITAKLVSCDETTLSVRRISDKKTFDIPLDQLNESSKATVESWKAKGGGLSEEFLASVATGKNRKKSGTDDFDDKRVNLDPVITITNQATKISSREAKVTTLFLGRPVADGSVLHVFRKSTFDLPSLLPVGSMEFKVGKISAAYDTRGYARFGSRYAGYVVLIHDADGKNILYSKSVPTSLVTGDGRPYLKLNSDMDYDRNFEPVKLPSYLAD
jgi:hypothetical protein